MIICSDSGKDSTAVTASARQSIDVARLQRDGPTSEQVDLLDSNSAERFDADDLAAAIVTEFVRG